MITRIGKRGRKPNYPLRGVVCLNPQWEGHGKNGLGSVVSNGSHPTRSGPVQKFLCQRCGQAFCSRSGNAFYGLRTSGEKVMLALKLLVKGMPLRGVAEVLGTKLDIVHSWLKRASAQAAQINGLLLQELTVSQVESDALWSFVKKPSFAAEPCSGGRGLDRLEFRPEVSLDPLHLGGQSGIDLGWAPGGQDRELPARELLADLGQ